jgi:hypothetical protein
VSTPAVHRSPPDRSRRRYLPGAAGRDLVDGWEDDALPFLGRCYLCAMGMSALFLLRRHVRKGVDESDPRIFRHGRYFYVPLIKGGAHGG